MNSMFDAIVASTDGSENAKNAVLSGLALARQFDAEFHGIHVVDISDIPEGVVNETTEAMHERSQHILDGVRTAAAEVEIEPITHMVETSGAIHDAIIEYALDRDLDLIIMGSRGRRGLERMLLGSVTARTIRHSPKPVLTVTDSPLSAEITDILIPTDGSRGAQAAAETAIEFATEANAGIHVINVVDVSGVVGEVVTASVYDQFEQIGRAAVDDVIQQAEEAGVRSIKAPVVRGRPARSILEYAAEEAIDVIVIGTHGRSGFDRYILGSVTEQVVRGGTRPILTVNVREFREE